MIPRNAQRRIFSIMLFLVVRQPLLRQEFVNLTDLSKLTTTWSTGKGKGDGRW